MRADARPGSCPSRSAESPLCGGDWMLDLERLRADEARGELRAVAEVPAASTACQLARRFCRSHLRAPRRRSRPARTHGRPAGRTPDGAVTLDFDSTGLEVSAATSRAPGSTTRASWPISRCCARGRSAAGCSRPSCWRATTRPAARSRGSCSGARWSTCPTVTARWPPASIRASTVSICWLTAARAGCASRSPYPTRSCSHSSESASLGSSQPVTAAALMSCSSRGYRPSWCAVPRGRPAEQGPAGDPFIGEDAGVLVSKAGTRAVDRVVRGDGLEQAGLAPDVAIGGGPEHEIALRRRRHCQDRGRARRLRRPRARVCAPEGPAPRGGVRCLTWQWPTRMLIRRTLSA